MPQPPINKLFFTLTPEVENRIANEVMDSLLVEIQRDIDAAFPDDMLPTMTELPAEARAERYGRITDPRDVPILQNQDYLDLMSNGQAPLPVSQFWRNAVVFPDIFRELQADYRRTVG